MRAHALDEHESITLFCSDLEVRPGVPGNRCVQRATSGAASLCWLVLVPLHTAHLLLRAWQAAIPARAAAATCSHALQGMKLGDDGFEAKVQQLMEVSSRARQCWHMQPREDGRKRSSAGTCTQLTAAACARVHSGPPCPHAARMLTRRLRTAAICCLASLRWLHNTTPPARAQPTMHPPRPPARCPDIPGARARG